MIKLFLFFRRYGILLGFLQAIGAHGGDASYPPWRQLQISAVFPLPLGEVTVYASAEAIGDPQEGRDRLVKLEVVVNQRKVIVPPDAFRDLQGVSLRTFDVVYEQWGVLTDELKNAVLIVFKFEVPSDIPIPSKWNRIEEQPQAAYVIIDEKLVSRTLTFHEQKGTRMVADNYATGHQATTFWRKLDKERSD